MDHLSVEQPGIIPTVALPQYNNCIYAYHTVVFLIIEYVYIMCNNK